MRPLRPEAARHLRRVNALEEELALEEFRSEQQWQRDPRIDQGEGGGGKGEQHAAFVDQPERSVLEPRGVEVG